MSLITYDFKKRCIFSIKQRSLWWRLLPLQSWKQQDLESVCLVAMPVHRDINQQLADLKTVCPLAISMLFADLFLTIFYLVQTNYLFWVHWLNMSLIHSPADYCFPDFHPIFFVSYILFSLAFLSLTMLFSLMHFYKVELYIYISSLDLHWILSAQARSRTEILTYSRT